MSLTEVLEQALETVYGGIVTPLDDSKIESIATLYRMPIDAILGTVVEMLLTDNRDLYKAVNSYHLAKKRESSREFLDLD